MDSSTLRALSSQLEQSAKALRQMADSQDAAQAILTVNCNLLNKSYRTALTLNVCSRRACIQLGVVTVRDLIAKTPRELLDVKGFGISSLYWVRKELNKYGLCLRGDDEHEKICH